MEPKEESNPTIDDVNDVKDAEEEYFESYEDIDIHRIMIDDKVRTEAYMNAIYNTKELFKDKIVMDVGSGTGILSLFCARAGAKKVFAVEASNLAKFIPLVAEKNNLQDIIEVIHSKVEDVDQNIKVDIIVSEWMGFYLLHESMLSSVCFARDHFLNPEGLMFPNSCQLYAAPCTAPEDLWKNQSDFWLKEKYGFDLSPFADAARTKFKPEIHSVKDGLLSDPQLLFDFNLSTLDPATLHSLQDKRFFSMEEDGEMQAVCIWFSCTFPSIPNSEKDVILSTAPWDEETHWKQTLVLFPVSTPVEAGDIYGWDFSMTSCPDNPRFYRISISILDGESEEHPELCNCGAVKCEIIKHYISNQPANSSSNADNTLP